MKYILTTIFHQICFVILYYGYFLFVYIIYAMSFNYCLVYVVMGDNFALCTLYDW